MELIEERQQETVLPHCCQYRTNEKHDSVCNDRDGLFSYHTLWNSVPQDASTIFSKYPGSGLKSTRISQRNIGTSLYRTTLVTSLTSHDICALIVPNGWHLSSALGLNAISNNWVSHIFNFVRRSSPCSGRDGDDKEKKKSLLLWSCGKTCISRVCKELKSFFLFCESVKGLIEVSGYIWWFFSTSTEKKEDNEVSQSSAVYES